jgi:uncharacterized LabA/DUF88 family protein
MATNNKDDRSKFAVKIESEDSDLKLAVLIDADNAQATIVKSLLAEIAKFGVASVKRIYGDWTQPQLSSWKKVLLELSIQPVQQFGYTKGKNATDSALIIDAMDLLYTRRFDGFCLVSSDSDFTRLAARLREEGLTVYGFGEKKTPEPFVSACDKFIYTELLRPIVATEVDLELLESSKITNSEQVPIELIVKSVDDVSEDNGWAQLGTVGSNITKIRPEFDSRLYGYKKFSNLVKSFPDIFEFEERSSGSKGGKAIYIRNKNYKSAK